MFYTINVLENSAKLTGKPAVPNSLDSDTDVFENLKSTFFTEHLRTTAYDFNSIFLLFEDVFVSYQINILLVF